MEKNNGIKFIIFGIILLIIIIGGFILMLQSDPDGKIEKPKKKEKVVDIRIDDKEDYIYFKDNDRAVDDLDIEYKTLVLNFKNDTNIENEQNEETKKLKESLKIDEDMEADEYGQLVSAKYKTYEYYAYDNYLSLVVNYYSFDRDNLVTFIESKAYVFNKETGKLYTEEELLNDFELTHDGVISKIKEYVDGQNMLEEDNELSSEDTIKNIDVIPAYVDRLGRLSVSILVKSDQKDYNDVVILS